MTQLRIRKAQNGDQRAFMELIAAHDRQIMSVICRFSGDVFDREDLYQDIFLHCFQSIQSYKAQSTFSTWLYRLSLNRCIDYERRRKPHYDLIEESVVQDKLNLEQRARLQAIVSALSRLEGPQRISFHLFYIEGWTYTDIANVLECREGTVKSHLNRARAKIRLSEEVLPWLATQS